MPTRLPFLAFALAAACGIASAAEQLQIPVSLSGTIVAACQLKLPAPGEPVASPECAAGAEYRVLARAAVDGEEGLGLVIEY